MGGAGADSPGPTAGVDTQEYNGASWTAGGDMISANLSNQGAGTQTDALTFGGNTTGTQTLGYDGTAWSTRPSLATGRTYFAGFGATGSGAIAAANQPAATTVEEYTGETSAANYKTITTS